MVSTLHRKIYVYTLSGACYTCKENVCAILGN
jgi:hypothetical protein